VPRTKNTSPTQISAVKHNDTRVNIPTEELRDFVAADEAQPKQVLYPRDPSLDPQLVWKGKDEQDSEDLAVDAVPIYIQEKIQPQAIIEEIRSQARAAKPAMQPSLFGDFNGIEFEQLVEFYHHEQHWTNRLILGDSLLAMTSLAEKEGLRGKVEMIYLDPPYGIEFGSNWQVSTRRRMVRDGRPEDATRQPEQIRAFRDTWRLGVHSYLAYLRDRLTAAQELLTTTGSVFVQIGDENLHLVRSVMDEVFGSANAHPVIVFRKKMMPMMKEPGFESVCDFILWYQNNKESSVGKLRPLFIGKSAEGDNAWNWGELPDGTRRRLTSAEIRSQSRVFQPISMLPREYRANQDFEFEYEGKKYPPPGGVCWSTDYEGMLKLSAARRLNPSGDEGLRYAYFHDDYPVARLTSTWMDASPATNMTYVVETNTTVVSRLMLACTDPGDLVLDPTCGGGTTAYVAEQWGRRWITTDTSRVALALARTRLMSARFPYYLLADSPEGQLKQSELSGVSTESRAPTRREVKIGFVYRRVPHVTLGSIANNPDIGPGMTLEDTDAAIARHADSETLFDQPYEDPKRVRVSGPFTVESLSPHRVISGDEDSLLRSGRSWTTPGRATSQG